MTVPSAAHRAPATHSARYHLVALLTVGVWGVTFVSTKVLLADLAPHWILLLRFALGLIALCLLRPRILRLKRRCHELLFAAAGATGIAAYYLLENVALVFTTATAVGVIVAAAPLFTALASAMLGERQALSLRFACGFLLAMAGLVLVSLGGNGAEGMQDVGASSLFGDLLALAAALVWAVYSILVRRIADLGYETVAATKRTFLWGLAFILPVTLAFGGPWPDLATLTQPTLALNLLFLGLVASATCFVTWGVAVKRLGATTASTYIYLVPAITAVSSILLLGEPLTLPIVVGLAMTIAGLVLSQGKAPHSR